jgi:multidrug efflux system membrane fusion protein
MAEDAPTAASPAAPPTTAPPKHSGGGIVVWIVVALAILGGIIGVIIYKHDKKPPPKVPPPITISTTNAVLGNIDEFAEYIATVTPIYTAMITPRVDGQIVRVNYTEGQMVTTNDLLAEIDPGPYQALLTEAEGQLERDKALLAGAKIDLNRYQEAYDAKTGHAVQKMTVDDQQALVHQDEGTVKFDEGQVANGKVQLAYCYIHAPINGRVGLRLIDPGNVVHAANSNALVVVTQLQPITLLFSVDQKYLPAIQHQLQAGHKMTVEAYNKDKTTNLATGTFLTMDNLVNLATGTVAIKGLFENKDVVLFPNQFANAKLIIDTLSNVTLIPTLAIQISPQGTFVYVVTNAPTKGPSTISSNDIKNWPGIIDQWRGQSNAVSAFLWQGLSNPDQLLLRDYQPSASSSNKVQDVVVKTLNKIIKGPDIYESERFKGVTLRPETTHLMQQNPTGTNAAPLNRLLLEDAYPLDLPRSQIVKMRPITVGPEDKGLTLVEGVKPGEVIAADNFNKLGDNMKVNLRPPGGEGQKGGAPGGRKQGGKKNTAQKDPS